MTGIESAMCEFSRLVHRRLFSRRAPVGDHGREYRTWSPTPNRGKRFSSRPWGESVRLRFTGRAADTHSRQSSPRDSSFSIGRSVRPPRHDCPRIIALTTNSNPLGGSRAPSSRRDHWSVV